MTMADQNYERCPQCTLSGYVITDELGRRCTFCGHKWPAPRIPHDQAWYENELSRLEDENQSLRDGIEGAQKLAWDLYLDREGLEQDGERLSDIHNLLAAISKERP